MGQADLIAVAPLMLAAGAVGYPNIGLVVADDLESNQLSASVSAPAAWAAWAVLRRRRVGIGGGLSRLAEDRPKLGKPRRQALDAFHLLQQQGDPVQLHSD